MKSAYELAMERLDDEDPDANAPLTDAQKKELAEIDKVYSAKFAEREIFLKQQLAEAQSAGKVEEITQIEEQLRSEKTRIAEECEVKKEAIRKG